MSLDQIRHAAPSVFASDPHASRSSRYTYIPTATIIEGMAKEGFLPFAATGQHYGDYSIHHKGDIAGDVIDASFRVLEQSASLWLLAENMQSLKA